jgi:chromosome segregation ATPase
MLSDKDATIKKLKSQSDKSKLHSQNLDRRIPEFETQIAELNLLVDQCTKDVERETKKRESAEKRASETREELRQFKEIYE